MIAFATESGNRTQLGQMTDGGFFTRPDGVEFNPVTAETRIEVDPSRVDPRLYDGSATARILADRPDHSHRGDFVAYVLLKLRAMGNRMYLVANAYDAKLAKREDMGAKSIGFDLTAECEVEAAALQNQGGAVVALND